MLHKNKNNSAIAASHREADARKERLIRHITK
jgi:hypothetical protein